MIKKIFLTFVLCTILLSCGQKSDPKFDGNDTPTSKVT